MVTITTHKAWYDLVEQVDRVPGEEFEADEARAGQILERLQKGWVTVSEADEMASCNLSALTVAQLRELCSERGVEVPKGAKKADIIALLEV